MLPASSRQGFTPRPGSRSWHGSASRTSGSCWGVSRVIIGKLDPVFLDFSDSRVRHKQRFLGEFFSAQLPERSSGKTFLEFFQIDKGTGGAKGILAIDLRKWKP